MTGRVGSPGLAVEDVVSVALRFAGGAVGTVHHAYALPARGYRSRLALRGLDASIELGLDDELVLLTAGDRWLRARGTDDVRGARRRPGTAPAGARRCATSSTRSATAARPQANGEALVHALELIDAAYESARTGRHVRLEPATKP